MTYAFQRDDRQLRPRLRAVEIAAIANQVAKNLIDREGDVTVQQTPPILTDIDSTGGGGDREVTATSLMFATNSEITGLKHNGVDVPTPPTLVIDNDGNVSLSIFGVSEPAPP